MTGRLRRQPLKISLPNRNRNIIKAAQPQNPTVAYNGPTPRGGLDYSRPRPRYGGPNRPAKSQRAGLSAPQRTQACFCRVSRSLSVLARVGCGATSREDPELICQPRQHLIYDPVCF